MPTTKAAYKLFTFAGIAVYIHWSWLLLAYATIAFRTHVYGSPVFKVLEFLSLFLIILIHEFGHQLACRQVGGETHDIILWPLGGVAYVSPPQRPGAELWSIAAGPLVNVALVPILSMIWSVSYHHGLNFSHPDLYEFIHNVWSINLVLLAFNLLPVFPLDGGQILRSLLWFVFGRLKSLLIACVFGLLVICGVIGWAVWKRPLAVNSMQALMTGAVVMFILMNCWDGIVDALALMRLAKLPRRQGYACPSCQAVPPAAALWRCNKCGNTFDFFLQQGACPHCGTKHDSIACVDCGESAPIAAWRSVPPTLEQAYNNAP